MPTEKPFDAMSDSEINEAVARRHGYVRFVFDEIAGGLWAWKAGNELPTRLPDWANDSGLAFADLWPILSELSPIGSLHLCRDRTSDLLPAIWDADMGHYWTEATWSRILCRAFIELVEAPDGK